MVSMHGEVYMLLHTVGASVLYSSTAPVDVWSISSMGIATVVHTALSYLWCSTRVLHLLHSVGVYISCMGSGTAAHPVVCWWSTVITDISMILVL